ncbi:sugar phosphate isomerase/epimerase family protein [Neobacillus vireti]|uniref:sugar phosphate isomerase/epimerase family protein n=1 Tax=Neobacillus vireti TaxID=220686 RepID=UPI002FFE15D5
MSLDIGLQLFSVKDELSADYFRTLEEISSIGYRNVELISMNMKNYSRFSDTVSATSLRNKLEELNLTPIGAHDGGGPPGISLLDNDWDRIIKYNYEIGCQWIAIPSAFMLSRDEALKTAEQLNHIGKQMKENGLKLYLHNHHFEFRRINEQETLYDVLIENTEPDHVFFELDILWAHRAGVDPIGLMERLGARCDVIHQKELYPFVPEEGFETPKFELPEIYKPYFQDSEILPDIAPLDLDRLYQKVNELGFVKYTIVENEYAESNKFASVAKDLKILQKKINLNTQSV